MSFMVNPFVLFPVANGIPQDYLARYVSSDVSGTTLNDQSANNYHGTIVGPVKTAGSLYFDGVDDRVTLAPLVTALNPTSAGTVAIQFRMVSGGRGYIGFGDASTGGYMQFSVSETEIIFAYKFENSASGTNNFVVRYTGLTLTAGNFYNAVITSDTTSGARLYVEGIGELTPNSNAGTPNNKWFDDNTSLDTARLQSLDYGITDLYYETYFVSATFYDYVVGPSGITELLSQAHPSGQDSVMFGDSITGGTGATTYSESWAGQWESSQYFGDNQGVSGDQAGDMSYNIQTNYASDADTVYTVMIGTNDHRQYKSDTTKQGFFEAFFRQSLAWLALPSRTNARSMTETGTWSNTGANTIGRVSTQNGATSTTSVSGTGVYIGYIIQNSLSSEGTAEVRIDGNLVGTISTYGQMNTINGRTFAPAAAYFGGLSSGSHTVEITVTSSGENFYLDYVAGSPQTPPDILVSNIIKMSASAYTTYGTSEANVIAYNGIIDDVLAEFTSDGVTITKVDNYSDIDPSTDLDTDGVHPNDTGHDIIYNNFVLAIP